MKIYDNNNTKKKNDLKYFITGGGGKFCLVRSDILLGCRPECSLDDGNFICSLELLR